MKLAEYIRRNASRWQPRVGAVLEAAELAVLSLPDPPHSTPRAACTLMRGESVRVDGAWRVIDRSECLRTSQGPAQTLLHLADGSILDSRFDYSYVSRDVDEQAAAVLA